MEGKSPKKKKLSTLTKMQSSLTSHVGRMTHLYHERRSLCKGAPDSLEARLAAKINNVRPSSSRCGKTRHSTQACIFKEMGKLFQPLKRPKQGGLGDLDKFEADDAQKRRFGAKSGEKRSN